mgnify:CR=1 FL=1
MLQQEISRNAGASRAQQIERATGFGTSALSGGLAMLVAAVRQSYWRQVARRRAHLAALELSRFDDRRLRDIGVERADIPKVTRGLVERAGALKPLRPTTAIAEPGFGTRQGQALGCCD